MHKYVLNWVRSELSALAGQSATLQREQHKALSKVLPPLYITVMLISLLFGFAYWTVSASFLPLIVNGVAVVFCMARTRYWLAVRQRLDGYPRKKIKGDMLGILILSPAIGFGYSLAVSTAMSTSATYIYLVVAVSILLVALAAAFALSVFPSAAISVVVMTMTPMALAMAGSDNSLVRLTTMSFVMSAVFTIYLVLENFNNFNEIVKSREKVVAESALLKKANAEISRLAFTDSLTGLANRRKFQTELEEQCRNCDSSGERLAVGIFDVDSFKTINDVYGHQTGDTVLKEIAARLNETVTGLGTVARIGGDEFVVILSNITDAKEVARTGETICQAVRELVSIDDCQVYTSMSGGFSIYPNETREYNNLLSQADIALREAKADGRNQAKVYDNVLAQALHEDARIEQALRFALKHDHLEMVFQPIVNIGTGEVLEFEALARWHHDEIGTISPDIFIPIAERSGLIEELTFQLLDKCCQTARTWPDEIKLSYNLSANVFRQAGAAEKLLTILRASGFPANRFNVELTETAFLHDVETAVKVINTLRSAGVTISLDDFGTGFSSLSKIGLIPLDTIKIDKSFVEDVATDRVKRSIIKAILTVAEDMSLDCVAEGIETDQQLGILKKLGSTHGQGYLFSKPVSAAQTLSCLRGQTLSDVA